MNMRDTILITGSNGFLGSHLVDLCMREYNQALLIPL